MNRTQRTYAALGFAEQIWSPGITCAALFGYPQHVRCANQSPANVEDLGTSAEERRM